MEVLTEYNPEGQNLISALTPDGGISDEMHRDNFRREKSNNTTVSYHVDKDDASYQERGLRLNARINAI